MTCRHDAIRRARQSVALQPPPRPRSSVSSTLVLILLACPLANDPSLADQASSRSAFEASYLTIGMEAPDVAGYPPRFSAPTWGEDQIEVQGIAHDNTNWYITATDRSALTDRAIDNAYLWKIPVMADLATIDVFNDPTVIRTTLYDVPQLWACSEVVGCPHQGPCGPRCPPPQLEACSDPLLGYVHWGDLDHYRFDGVDYLVVPMTSPTANCLKGNPHLLWGRPAIVVFRGSDLSYVGYGLLPGPDSLGQRGHGQRDVAWCAVQQATGRLYSSPDSTRAIFRYRIPWESFNASQSADQFTITWEETDSLKDKDATVDTTIDLHNMQGGEFTPRGELLYISNGSANCAGGGADDAGWPTDGIHAFDTSTWREVKHSNNRCAIPGHAGNSNCIYPQTDYFDFTYDFDCGFREFHTESPEGLTIWDLDQVPLHDPHVSGQLHVLVADVGSRNRCWLGHFSGKIFVGVNGLAQDCGWTTPLAGSEERPFTSVTDAFTCYPAWDGSEVVLQAGNYPETTRIRLTPTGRVHVVAQGGPATIGK